ncbi:transcriptional regulator ATRX [Lingula anatina]|uniref:ATP-dependent helicase ATRX n=1 Tax=Lingula anatina TaxID=7574 RepID=A0A1S3HLB0_LINAN|nr:transcriptional regulator ATRX [Lingula anatina]|eukprot:XP_013386812.1 transcriptional regulator ATRX [Lingula anatina]
MSVEAAGDSPSFDSNGTEISAIAGAPSGGSDYVPAKAKRSKLDVLVKKLQVQGETSNPASPVELEQVKASSSGSSRRKPKVTRKYVESEEEEGEEETSGNMAPLLPVVTPIDLDCGGDAENKVREDIQLDDQGNPILPEGTVMVQPVAVEDLKSSPFKGPEVKTRSRKMMNVEDPNAIVNCTACGKQVNHKIRGKVLRHPILRVLICKKCYKYYSSGEFDKDEDGFDEQCRWCAEGGRLQCCDYCTNAFCRNCIKRNLGRSEYSAVEGLGDNEKWRCYVCNPLPLTDLVAQCTNVLAAVEKEHRADQRKQETLKSKLAKKTDKQKDPESTTLAKKSQRNTANKSKEPTASCSDKVLPVQIHSSTAVTDADPPANFQAQLYLEAQYIDTVLDKQLAATHSMTKFLREMKEQVRVSEKGFVNKKVTVKNMVTRIEVAKKLRRAVVTYQAKLGSIQAMARHAQLSQRMAVIHKAAVLPTQTSSHTKTAPSKEDEGSDDDIQIIEEVSSPAPRTPIPAPVVPDEDPTPPLATTVEAPILVNLNPDMGTIHVNAGSGQSVQEDKDTESKSQTNGHCDANDQGSKKRRHGDSDDDDDDDDQGPKGQAGKQSRTPGSGWFRIRLKGGNKVSSDSGGKGGDKGGRENKDSEPDKPNVDDEGQDSDKHRKNTESADGNDNSHSDIDNELREELQGIDETSMDIAQAEIAKKTDTGERNAKADSEEGQGTKSSGKDEITPDQTEDGDSGMKMVDDDENQDKREIEKPKTALDNFLKELDELNSCDSGTQEEQTMSLDNENENLEELELEEMGFSSGKEDRLECSDEENRKEKLGDEEKIMSSDTVEELESAKKVEPRHEKEDSDAEKKETDSCESNGAKKTKNIGSACETESFKKRTSKMEKEFSDRLSKREKSKITRSNKEEEEDGHVSGPESRRRTRRKLIVRETGTNSNGSSDEEGGQISGSESRRRTTKKMIAKENGTDSGGSSDGEDGQISGFVSMRKSRKKLLAKESGTMSDGSCDEEEMIQQKTKMTGEKDELREKEKKCSIEKDTELSQQTSGTSKSDERSDPDIGKRKKKTVLYQHSKCSPKMTNGLISDSDNNEIDEHSGDEVNTETYNAEESDDVKRGKKGKSRKDDVDSSEENIQAKQQLEKWMKEELGSESDESSDDSLGISNSDSDTAKKRKKKKKMAAPEGKKPSKPTRDHSLSARLRLKYGLEDPKILKPVKVLVSREDGGHEQPKKHKKPISETQQKTKAREVEHHVSDSSNYDSDLEKEIDKLANIPLRKKKRTKREDEAVERGPSDEEKRENKTRKNREKTTPKKKRSDSSSDSVDSESDTDIEEEEEEEVNLLSNDEKKLKAIKLKNEEEDENIRAKQAMLREMSDEEEEEDDVSDNSSDDNSENLATKKKKSKENGALSESSDSDFVTPKKLKKNLKLLRVKLSESDSDAPVSTKEKKKKIKRSKKRKRKTNSDESDASSTNFSSIEIMSEDSDFESKKKSRRDKKNKKEKDSESLFSSDESDEDLKTKKGKKGNERSYTKKGNKKRKRIKLASDSSNESNKNSDEEAGSGDENDDENTPGRKRKKIRKILKEDKLQEETKTAAKLEEERRKRISDRQQQFNVVLMEDGGSPNKCPVATQLVLEMKKDSDKPLIQVNKSLVKNLKPHQIEAVQFMWDCLIESLDQYKKDPEGSGCILAHCMGLGKTLSVITFAHTVLTHPKYLPFRRCLVICPLNTVLNWQNEWTKWLEEEDRLDVYELSSVKNNHSRADCLQDWHEGGGVMIMGYEMFRNLSQSVRVRNKRQKRIFAETLLDPGPDIVVCDEGHVLKNSTSAISKAVSQIKSKRRVVLTGTPLQNNLKEYHCMVDFVKPNLLGTAKEFGNRFVNPISNGQCKDSTPHDVKIMKRRAHILHDLLSGCVQRKDYSALTKFLPPKFEYVLLVRLSKLQVLLYRKYLQCVQGVDDDGMAVVGRGAKIFSDYQALMRIWTHPRVMRYDQIRRENKAFLEDNDSFIDDESDMSSFIDDGSSDSIIDLSDSDQEPGPSKGKNKKKGKGKKSCESQSDDEVVKEWKTRKRGGDGSEPEEVVPEVQALMKSEWWHEFVTEEDEKKIENSGKLLLLFEVLRMAEEIGDKVLVFSQSLLSLDLIQDFLEDLDKKAREEMEKTKEGDEKAEDGFQRTWVQGADYYRMDGSTPAQTRQNWAEEFNDPDNFRARLFLISTRAGSLGINLIGANRVILFDASWNPSHDVQSIFRVYRFGQTKPCYVYRFLAQGTMEEKIYERQVTKLSLSQRVVDEHQIDRHFTAQDLQELYNFKPDLLDDPDRVERPTPALPKDRVLAELLTSHKDWIVQILEHDSLLENKIDQTLTEEERKAAWEEYENEKKGIRREMSSFYGPGASGSVGPIQYSPAVLALYQSLCIQMPSLAVMVKPIIESNPRITAAELQIKIQGLLRYQQVTQQMQKETLEKQQQQAYQQYQQLQRQRQLQENVVQMARQRQALYEKFASSGGSRP